MQVWPAPGHAPQSFDLWQPSPITPQYWPPVGVHDTGVHGAASAVGMPMSTVGFTSAITGASTPTGTSIPPPSLPPGPGVALTPAVQPASSAAAARNQTEARGLVRMASRCPAAFGTVQHRTYLRGITRLFAGRALRASVTSTSHERSKGGRASGHSAGPHAAVGTGSFGADCARHFDGRRGGVHAVARHQHQSHHQVRNGRRLCPLSERRLRRREEAVCAAAALRGFRRAARYGRGGTSGGLTCELAFDNQARINLSGPDGGLRPLLDGP